MANYFMSKEFEVINDIFVDIINNENSAFTSKDVLYLYFQITPIDDRHAICYISTLPRKIATAILVGAIPLYVTESPGEGIAKMEALSKYFNDKNNKNNIFIYDMKYGAGTDFEFKVLNFNNLNCKFNTIVPTSLGNDNSIYYLVFPKAETVSRSLFAPIDIPPIFQPVIANIVSNNKEIQHSVLNYVYSQYINNDSYESRYLFEHMFKEAPEELQLEIIANYGERN